MRASGDADVARTRALYAGCGDDEEARVRDCYRVGEDVVLVRKVL